MNERSWLNEMWDARDKIEQAQSIIGKTSARLGYVGLERPSLDLEFAIEMLESALTLMQNGVDMNLDRGMKDAQALSASALNFGLAMADKIDSGEIVINEPVCKVQKAKK